MDKVTRASRRDDFIGAMYSITHFYLPLPWYSKVLDKDEAIAYRQEYGEFNTIRTFLAGIEKAEKSHKYFSQTTLR